MNLYLIQISDQPGRFDVRRAFPQRIAGRLPTLLAVIAILFHAAGVHAATSVRVGNSATAAMTFLPLYIGLDQGTFEKNGLDVEVVDLPGGAKVHQAIVAGAVDFGLGSGTELPFLIKGAPEKVVGSIALTPALLGIVVPNNTSIQYLADLKGKRIGISTVGSSTEWVALQLARKEGWPESSFTLVAVGSMPASQVAAIETGQVDAQVSGAVLGWDLERQKKGRLLVPATDFASTLLMYVIFASDRIIAADPAAVRAFVKSWYEAVDFMATHKAAAVAAETKLDGFPQSIDEKEYDLVMPSLSLDGTFPPDAIANTARSFVELKLLPNEPEITKYLTTKFLPSVTQ